MCRSLRHAAFNLKEIFIWVFNFGYSTVGCILWPANLSCGKPSWLICYNNTCCDVYGPLSVAGRLPPVLVNKHICQIGNILMPLLLLAVMFGAIWCIVDSGSSTISPQVALWPDLARNYANLWASSVLCACFSCYCFLHPAFSLQLDMLFIWASDCDIYRNWWWYFK